MIQLLMNAAMVGDTWVIILLLLASLLSVAIMYERWRLFRAGKVDLAALMDGIAACLGRHDVEGALALARKSESVEGRVAAAGIEQFPKGPAAVEEVMTSRVIQERLALERNLIVLGTLGNNAPFLGLFGTVLGIIKAFHDLALSGSAGASVVMAGISSALICTALGILVALPAVIANNSFQSLLKRRMSNSESLSRILLGYLKTEKP